jgi:hypothetical protein
MQDPERNEIEAQYMVLAIIEVEKTILFKRKRCVNSGSYQIKEFWGFKVSSTHLRVETLIRTLGVLGNSYADNQKTLKTCRTV